MPEKGRHNKISQRRGARGAVGTGKGWSPPSPTRTPARSARRPGARAEHLPAAGPGDPGAIDPGDAAQIAAQRAREGER